VIQQFSNSELFGPRQHGSDTWRTRWHRGTLCLDDNFTKNPMICWVVRYMVPRFRVSYLPPVSGAVVAAADAPPCRHRQLLPPPPGLHRHAKLELRRVKRGVALGRFLFSSPEIFRVLLIWDFQNYHLSLLIWLISFEISSAIRIVPPWTMLRIPQTPPRSPG
jgi:hypothetical protein